jgi:two-component system, sensor histidine kinase and response regulator
MKHNGEHNPRHPVILIVDDTEDNLDLLEFGLKQKPVTMLRATTGNECLKIAKEKRPDIIVLDIQMPGMDGFKTLEKLRANPLTSSIPVILLTAQYKDPESIEKGFKAGADEYLTKPIDIEELLVRVRMLIRMKTMMEELDKTKSDFTAMLIHDLRSPLVSIKSVIELVRDLKPGDLLHDNHFQMFNSAEASLDQMLTLINNFLDLSKYTAATVCLHQEPIPLHVLIEVALGKVEFQYKQKQIQLAHDIDSSLPDVYVDAQKIQQVLLNLLDNALKFTRRGGTVRVCARPHAGITGNGSREPSLLVSVTDTGIGINDEERRRLFYPYQQTSSAESISEKGTGLGLSICKMIVEAHGGSISVASDPGEHTTFYFTLPVAQNTNLKA